MARTRWVARASRWMELVEGARKVGLYVSKYSPGDNMRYRFFTEPTDYFGGNGVYTASGIREAEIFLSGYVQGKQHGFDQGKKWGEVSQGTILPAPLQGAIMGQLKA